MREDIESGWWGVPGRELWRCAECKLESPVLLWKEVEVSCGDCGGHDGRQCPNCGESYDHVWGAKVLAKAQQYKVIL